MPRANKPRQRPARRPGISYPTLKGGAPLPTFQPRQPAFPTPWTDPTFRYGGSSPGGGGGGLPWWLQGVGGGGVGAPPGPPQPPDVSMGGGYVDYGGPSQIRPGAGDEGISYGSGSPYADAGGGNGDPALLWSLITGGTGGLGGQILRRVGQRYTGPGESSPFEQGSHEPHGYQLSDFGVEGPSFWNILNPGQGVGGGGAGGPMESSSSPVWRMGRMYGGRGAKF